MHESKTDEIIKKIFFGNCNVLTPFQLLINKCHVCLPVGKIYYLYGRSYIVMKCLFSLTLTPQAHRDFVIYNNFDLPRSPNGGCNYKQI